MQIKDCTTIEELQKWADAKTDHGGELSFSEVEEALSRAYELGRAQLAERDAQLAILRMSIQQMEATNATRQPTQDKGE